MVTSVTPVTPHVGIYSIAAKVCSKAMATVFGGIFSIMEQIPVGVHSANSTVDLDGRNLQLGCAIDIHLLENQ